MAAMVSLTQESGLVAMRAWFQLGQPAKIPIEDTREALILRGYALLMGLGNGGVDLRRSRRLLMQSDWSQGYEILMNVAALAFFKSHAPEAGGFALDWAAKAVEKGSAKAFSVRALFALVAPAHPRVVSLAVLRDEASSDAGALAAVARTLHALRHPEALAWIMVAEEAGAFLPFEHALCEEMEGRAESAATLIRIGADAGDVACCRRLLQGEDEGLSINKKRAYAKTGADQLDPACAFHRAKFLIEQGPDVEREAINLLLTGLLEPGLPEAEEAQSLLDENFSGWEGERSDFTDWLFRRLASVTYEPSRLALVDLWQRMVFHPRARQMA